MNLKLFGLRAATSAKNDASDISESTCELYRSVLAENKIDEMNIVSLQIGLTNDLTAINPATALRSKNFATTVPLFCTQEPIYENSKPGIIRFMLLFYAKENFQPRNVYLKDASNLKSEMITSANASEKRLWLVSREYAGIAEEGGLKNVVKAIAENASDAGVEVTVFMPKYQQSKVQAKKVFTENICIAGENYTTDFFETRLDGVQFVFVSNALYNSKQGIYTYTENEANNAEDPNVQKGEAYADIDKMNLSFQFAILTYAKTRQITPNVIHCHDGHTAFLPSLIENDIQAKELFKNTKFFITIHNAGDSYRQQLWQMDYAKSLTGLSNEVLQKGFVEGGIEPFLVSANYATLTTVSPWYAKELKDIRQSPFSYNFSKAISEKNIDIIGITNGLEYKNYNPTDKSASNLPFTYNPLKEDFDGKYKCRKYFLDKLKEQTTSEWIFSDELSCYGTLANGGEKLLYFAYHGRVVHQKGIDILLKAIENLCPQNKNIRFLIMGQGTVDYENEYIQMTKKFIGQVIYFKGYNKKIARLVTAVSDFILLPSLFEPCGLEDFIAQVYATLPIAHAIGGLNKIDDGETGFLFSVKDENEKFSIDKISQAMEEIVVQIAKDFLKSNNNFLLEDKKFSDMVVKANKKILDKYNWKKIVREKYFKLYGF